MQFRSIDEYDLYVQQVNDEHWEQMTMRADDIEDFHEAMSKIDEEIQSDRGGVYLPTDPGAKTMTPTDADVSPLWDPKERAKKEKVAAEAFGSKDRLRGTKDYEYVNKPKHYDWFDIQAIDAIAKVLTHDELKGFLMGTALRYRLRMGTKPNEPIERDIKKAEWYENYWEQYKIDNTPK